MEWAGEEMNGELDTKARDTVAFNTIGTEPNSHLASDPGSEHHHLDTSEIGVNGGQLEI